MGTHLVILLACSRVGCNDMCSPVDRARTNTNEIGPDLHAHALWGS